MEMTLITLAILTHAVDTAPLTLLGINYLLFTENGERGMDHLLLWGRRAKFKIS